VNFAAIVDMRSNARDRHNAQEMFPWALLSLEKIGKLALTRTADPNQPMTAPRVK